MLYIKNDTIVSSALKEAFSDSIYPEKATSGIGYFDATTALNESAFANQIAMFEAYHSFVDLETEVIEAYSAAEGNEALLEGYLRPLKENFLEKAFTTVKNFLMKIVNAVWKGIKAVAKFFVGIFNTIKNKVKSLIKKKEEAKEGDKKEEAKQAAPGISAQQAAPAAKAAEAPKADAKSEAPKAAEKAAPAAEKTEKILPFGTLLSTLYGLRAFVYDMTEKLTDHMVQRGFYVKKCTFKPSDLPKELNINGLLGFDDHTGQIKSKGPSEMANIIKDHYSDKMQTVTLGTCKEFVKFVENQSDAVKKLFDDCTERLNKVKMFLNKVEFGKDETANKRAETVYLHPSTEDEDVKAHNDIMKYNIGYFNSVVNAINNFSYATMKLWDESAKIVTDFASAK